MSMAAPVAALPDITHVLYLHGFRSSPRSAKATLTHDWMLRHHPDVTWLCPQLPPSPAEAMAQLLAATADWPQPHSAVMGSSLGGFYAAALAARRGWRAVLLNPAVDPARDLARYLGEQTFWHAPEERFYFQPAYIGELQTIDRETRADEHRRAAEGTLAPACALICQGDEVLDWREMAARHARAELHVLPGGDHAISDYARHLPQVMDFLGLGTRP